MNDTCPVCKLPIQPATGYRIPRHKDSIGKNCPTSGRDYRIAEIGGAA